MPTTRFEDFAEANEVTYARGRLTTRTYVSRSFTAAIGQDVGHPSRYIYRVFDEVEAKDSEGWEWTNHVVLETHGGRKQLQLQIARSQGAVRRLRIQRVPANGDETKLERVLDLNRTQARSLIDLLRAVDDIPIEGETTVHVDDQLLRDVFEDPWAVERMYSGEPERFRDLIESDANADDVIALQRRREVAAMMRRWLDEPVAFDAAAADAGGPEKAWQQLLEENPWILGVGLGGQILTSWDDGRLEQTVVGPSFTNAGKRADALMRTTGVIQSLVFAEIKHHRTDLLKKEYRPGCWSPSPELAGAVVQVQQTVHRACQEVGDYLQDQTDEGELLTSGTFLVRPRCFVIVGLLDQLTGASGGPVRDKVRSFELFRRNLNEPEVLTFDELVARAEWHVEFASTTSAGAGYVEEASEEGEPDPWNQPSWGPTDPWGPPAQSAAKWGEVGESE
ncbi:hypothetical protein J2S40_003398 [Nocardioides luteus]|uniref:Shedu protein SduA C-terminal domain-containing protein n=1 Tax=Nocardioides luteus TaxID=1844 RepID=A0ABQ5SXN6_9ACTN|nr:Shedu immune nuclease family protein [Nocardioides luteus]MDR7312340.1 hypothetical protein [Nocardioides luteus]GGR57832.1 hypothetical protein GCM10010197_25640 [Nocardioides luteus]GLJ68586.1 hypothetical protein GCM10017579_26220 [Nocardioides luteus]